MENASYTTLTRQSGLMREMQIVANNIANAATTGYRAEGLIFSASGARLSGLARAAMDWATIRTKASRLSIRPLNIRLS